MNKIWGKSGHQPKYLYEFLGTTEEIKTFFTPTKNQNPQN